MFADHALSREPWGNIPKSREFSGILYRFGLSWVWCGLSWENPALITRLSYNIWMKQDVDKVLQCQMSMSRKHLLRGMMTFPKWWSSASFNQHQGLSLESFWCIWDPPRACWMLNCNSSIFCCAKHIPAKRWKIQIFRLGSVVPKSCGKYSETGFFTLILIIKKRTSLKSHTPKKVAEHNYYPPKKKKKQEYVCVQAAGVKELTANPSCRNTMCWRCCFTRRSF